MPTGPEPRSAPLAVPRPTDALPGRPAPWVDLEDSARRGITIERLVATLRAAGRGLDASVPPEPLDELSGVDAVVTDALRDAAVLVAAFEEAGEARLVLTRRSASLRRHRGEVAFPGGRIEEGEAPLDAALREANEEIGLAVAAVTPVAWLRPLVTFASGSLIRPFVAVLESRPTFVIQPTEVERAFDVAIAELLADDVFHEERWRRPSPRPVDGDGSFPINFFELDGETIWGATARILTELCCLVAGVAPR